MKNKEVKNMFLKKRKIITMNVLHLQNIMKYIIKELKFLKLQIYRVYLVNKRLSMCKKFYLNICYLDYLFKPNLYDNN